jgi:hypothetical protein
MYIVLDGELEVTIVDKIALEAAIHKIRRKCVASIDQVEVDDMIKAASKERAYIRNLAGIAFRDCNPL